MRRNVLAVTLFVTLAGCGGKTGTAAGDVTPTPNTSAATRGARRQANVVTADEIKAQGGTNLRDVLQALRPAWFRVTPTRMTGGGVVADPISLFVDGRRVGTASNLNEGPLASVVAVRFYSASEAQGRFGMDNLSGAIEVTTH
jgi:hypothetical protein